MPFIVLHDTVPWESEINKLVYDLYFHPNEKARMLQIEMAFCKMWMILLEHAPKNAVSETKVSYEQLSLVKAMTSFVETHYSRHISISDIALAGSVSVSKCYRLFHSFLGMTPSEYLCRYRLDQSIRLMQTTDKSMIEIALSVGFHGASYFSETFKKYYQCAPSVYRKKK